MNDERIERGSLFCREDFRDRGGICCVGGKSVHGFGWKCHDIARAKELYGRID
jgi:hypothetical protein